MQVGQSWARPTETEFPRRPRGRRAGRNLLRPDDRYLGAFRRKESILSGAGSFCAFGLAYR